MFDRQWLRFDDDRATDDPYRPSFDAVDDCDAFLR